MAEGRGQTLRTVHINPPSVRAETLNVVKAAAAIVVIVAAYIFRPAFGAPDIAAPVAGLLPYQQLIRDASSNEQRVYRELQEEVTVAGPLAGLRPLGILKDDSNAVGQVHVGLVFEAEVNGGAVRVRETDRMTGRFVTLPEARAHRDGMESWSQLLLDALGERP